jgi:hypothetical protein
MKRFCMVLLSGCAGLLFCIGAVAACNAAGIGPHFGAVAGEDDFNLRVAVFLFCICPAFFGIGAWSGHNAGAQLKAHLAVWLGIMSGTLLTLGAAPLVSMAAAGLRSRDTLNLAAIGYMLAWVLLWAGGALISRWWLGTSGPQSAQHANRA